jgi:O-antigen/teichoic acid export membrane protein
MKHLVHISIAVTGVRVLGIIIQSGIMLYLANCLPIEDMGVYALFYASAGIVRLLGPLGLDQVNMRYIAGGLGPQGLGLALHRLLNTSYLLTLASCIFLTVAVWALTTGASSMFGLTQLKPVTIAVFACAVPAFVVTGLFVAEIRAFGHQLSAQVPDSLLLQVFMGCGLGVYAFVGKVDLAAALLCLSVAAWLVAIIYILMRLRIGVLLSAKASWDDAITLMQEFKHVLTAKAITVVSIRGPLLLSAPLLGAAGTAILDLAFRFGTLPSLTTTSVAATFAPNFAMLVEKKNTAQLSRALSLASLLAAIPAIIYFVVIAIAGPFLFKALLPPAYGGLYAPMLIICAASAINATYGLASDLLFMANRSRIVSVFSAGRLVITLLLCVLFAEPFGVLGFAIAILIGTAIRDVGIAIWTSRKLSVALPPLGFIDLKKN